jgi:hypothetical protein
MVNNKENSIAEKIIVAGAGKGIEVNISGATMNPIKIKPIINVKPRKV